MIHSRDSRRRFLLQLSALAVSGWSLSRARPLRAQPKLATVRLSDRMVALLGPGANVVAADSGDGVVMVDGGHASWSDAVLRAVGEQFASRARERAAQHSLAPRADGLQRGARRARRADRRAREHEALARQRSVGALVEREVRATAESRAAGDDFLRVDERCASAAAPSTARTCRRRTRTATSVRSSPTRTCWLPAASCRTTAWPIIDWWTGGWTGGMLDGFEQLLEIANDRTRIVPASGPVM